MKFVFTHILLLLCSITVFGQHAAFAPRMEYHFSWDGKSSLLTVDLRYTPSVKDTTSFVYGMPEAGNQLDIFRMIKNLHAGPGDDVTIDSAKRKITVRHRSAGLKTLHYEISGALISAAKHNNANEQFRPQLLPGAFYSLSFNLFMQVDTNIYKQATMVWDKWPAGFGYFSSAGPGSKPGKPVVIPAAQLMNVYMAMDKQLTVRKYLIAGVPYYAVTSGRDSVNDMQADLKPFFSTFFPAITNFWNDYGGKDYFVSVLPFMHQVPNNYTGFGLVDGFSMRYRGPYDPEKMMVIAHETSHKWIGNKLKIKQKGMEYMWFEEGFNDYIAIALLAKAGMLAKPDFVSYINNKNLAPHYKSPVRTAPADSIGKYFWVNHDYEHLPYQRGFIYAFYFDNQIRLASGGTKTIKNFLLALLKRASANNYREMSIDDFVATASLFLSKEQVSAGISKYLQQGQLLDFHNIRLTGGFTVSYDGDVPVLSVTSDAALTQFLIWE